MFSGGAEYRGQESLQGGGREILFSVLVYYLLTGCIFLVNGTRFFSLKQHGIFFLSLSQAQCFSYPTPHCCYFSLWQLDLIFPSLLFTFSSAIVCLLYQVVDACFIHSCVISSLSFPDSFHDITFSCLDSAVIYFAFLS